MSNTTNHSRARAEHRHRDPELAEPGPDYAVRPIQDTSSFWPAPCDPCTGGPVRTPEADCGPALDVTPARGGCVRPRFFDGMFLSREDLETQLRYLRLKLRLQNRAAGAGVVWGLGVSMRGEDLVVAPGYGVDSCGNDLTVTCDYAVPARLLLSDPAVCSDPRGERCYALLLEYVECPEEPRPVHGDGCGPSTPGCEMSRIRETVRLRLVPPRPVPPGPLAGLVAELEALSGGLRARERRADLAERSAETPAPESVPVPFTVVTTIGDQTELQPSRTQTVQAAIERIDLAAGMFSLRVRPHQGVADLAGTVRRDDGGAVATLGPNGAVWSTMTGKAGGFTFTVDWSGRTDAVLQGSTTIHVVIRGGDVVEGFVSDTGDTSVYVVFPSGHDLRPGDRVAVERADATGNTFLLPVAEVVDDEGVVLSSGPDQPVRPQAAARYNRPYELETSVAPTRIVQRQPAAGRPCCDPGCCSGHEGPSLQERLQVLLVALLYGRLVQQHAALAIRDRPESVKALASSMRLLLEVRPAQQVELERLVAALYRAWCGAAIYAGPERLDPDGVVIGCVSIRNGAVCEVDELDGRRWVVHQPLIDHWSSQFGLDPLDAQVTALFRRLCCLAGLPGFEELFGGPEQVERPPAEPPSDEQRPAEELPMADLAFAEMSMQAMAMTPKAAPEPSIAGTAASTMLARLALVGSLDLPTIALLVEELLCGRARMPAVVRSPDKAMALVASAHAELAPRDQPNMALREVARDITHAVLEVIPAAFPVAEDSPVRRVLEEARIDSIEASIALDRDSLRAAGAHLVTDEQVREAMEATEATAAVVSRFVARAIRDASGLSEPQQLEDPDIAEAVTERIVSRLADERIDVDRAAILRAVTRRSR